MSSTKEWEGLLCNKYGLHTTQYKSCKNISKLDLEWKTAWTNKKPNQIHNRGIVNCDL